MNPQIVQAVGGYVMSLAMMALVLFSQKLGLTLDADTKTALIFAAMAGVGLGAHGTAVNSAKKLDGQDPPSPGSGP